MIPDVHLDTIALGPLRIHPFGLLLAIGIVAAHIALVRRARALAPPRVVEGFAIALGAGALLTALATERLGIAGLSSVAAAAGALAAAAAYTAARRLDALRFADAAAWAFPFGWILCRAGCALAHDHLGAPSRSLLAVAFATGPRLDLGLIEWMLTPLLFASATLARRLPRPGAEAGAVLSTYALIRFPLDFLRTGEAGLGPLTFAQWASALAFVAGIVLVTGRYGEPVSQDDT